MTTPVDALGTRLTDIAASLPGRLGVSVDFIDHGVQAGIHQDDLFPTASVIKVPIMVELYRRAEAGDLALTDALPLRADDVTDGSGVLQFLHVGLPLTIGDAVELMIIVSDNTATNMVLRLVGAAQVNAGMQALGLTQTHCAGRIGAPATDPGAPAAGQFHDPPGLGRSRTTPREMTALLAALARGDVVSPAASAAMLEIMGHQLDESMLRSGLPIHTDLSESGPHWVRIVHKTGAMEGIRNDVGIITVERDGTTRRAVVSAFTADMDDANLWTPQNVGCRAIAQVAGVVYEALVEMG